MDRSTRVRNLAASEVPAEWRIALRCLRKAEHDSGSAMGRFRTLPPPSERLPWRLTGQGRSMLVVRQGEHDWAGIRERLVAWRILPATG
jgi:hypothetical protein